MRVSHTNNNPVMTEHEDVECDWNSFATQLLEQWKRLERSELECTQHNRHVIAELIERKYGVHAVLVENYLRNLERTMPLLN